MSTHSSEMDSAARFGAELRGLPHQGNTIGPACPDVL